MSSAQRALPLFGAPQRWLTDIYAKRFAFTLVVAHAEFFRVDFMAWLSVNYRIWRAFEYEADRIWDRGRRHYSARTIGEYLRHETALREEGGDLGFKLNDHYVPDLGRLYMLFHPDREGFFERRPGGSAVRVR